MKNHNCGAEAGAEAPVNENDKNTSTPTWLELQPISTMAEKPDLEASSLDILDQLSPAWRLFLLGDGSPTRHLRLLTGSPTAVDVIEFVSIGMDVSNCPAEVALVPGPRSRRQVWLKTESGERLGYAVSWWNSSKVESFFNDKALPIGMNVVQYKQELYRDILSTLTIEMPLNQHRLIFLIR